jgi:hypothetical protein
MGVCARAFVELAVFVMLCSFRCTRSRRWDAMGLVRSGTA